MFIKKTSSRKGSSLITEMTPLNLKVDPLLKTLFPEDNNNTLKRKDKPGGEDYIRQRRMDLAKNDCFVRKYQVPIL